MNRFDVTFYFCDKVWKEFGIRHHKIFQSGVSTFQSNQSDIENKENYFGKNLDGIYIALDFCIASIHDFSLQLFIYDLVY